MLAVKVLQRNQNSGVIDLLILPRDIPKRQFDAVPHAQLVIDQAQVVLHHVLCGPERIGDFPVLAALGDELNDELLTFAGTTAACCFSNQNFLR